MTLIRRLSSIRVGIVRLPDFSRPPFDRDDAEALPRRFFSEASSPVDRLSLRLSPSILPIWSSAARRVLGFWVFFDVVVVLVFFIVLLVAIG